ncbi:MAG: RNA polymerase sporulation sigma factor SigK [Oscillospiraceae bacterium]|jgi:RNA polymerase sporulation-specific sigma factor|nr:RNA polymerase sporulation sigma factor SigK [Oscillospiraceae bacterium]
MLSVALLLLMHGLSLSLRLGGPTGSFPRPLSAREEKEALERLAAGDQSMRALLIEKNMRLVAHVIKKYYTTASDQEDLLSIGTIGLIKAISSYRPDRDVKLPTYACKCIQNEIFMYFRRQRRRAGEISLSEPIETDREGGALALIDVLSADDLVLEKMEKAESAVLLRRLVQETLDDREREIVELRYGLHRQCPLTQRAVAARLRISRSYVSRLEKKALGKLETAYRAQGGEFP